MSSNDVHLPDIGDFKNVPVIEVSVSPGDVISVDDVIIVLESDKATMDIPSPVAGTVAEVRIKPGDTVSQGDLILVMAEAATPRRRAEAHASPTPPGPALPPPPPAPPRP